MENKVAVFSTKHHTVFENWIANKIRCLKKAVAAGLKLNDVVSEFPQVLDSTLFFETSYKTILIFSHL